MEWIGCLEKDICIDPRRLRGTRRTTGRNLKFTIGGPHFLELDQGFDGLHDGSATARTRYAQIRGGTEKQEYSIEFAATRMVWDGPRTVGYGATLEELLLWRELTSIATTLNRMHQTQFAISQSALFLHHRDKV